MWWYSSLQSGAQVDIPAHTLWVLISRRICHADPRFPQDQRPSCEQGNDSQLQMWHTHTRVYRLTHATCLAHPHMCPDSPVQAEVIKVMRERCTHRHTPSATATLLSSHLRQEGTCQRMLSTPSSRSSQSRRRRENKWTPREPIKLLISRRSAGHWGKSD